MICQSCGYDDNETGDFAHACAPLNLSDPAVQKRLAAQWGYVPAGSPYEPMDSSYTELLDSAQKIVESYVYFRRFVAGTPLENDIAVWMADFVVAQPAPNIPEGYKLVPIEPTTDMLCEMERQWMCGSQIDMAKREWKAALAAAPEAKP